MFVKTSFETDPKASTSQDDFVASTRVCFQSSLDLAKIRRFKKNVNIFLGGRKDEFRKRPLSSIDDASNASSRVKTLA